MNADWFVAIGTVILAIGTIILALVAIFQDKIRNYFWRPELDVEFSMTHPDCHKTKLIAKIIQPFQNENGDIENVAIVDEMSTYYFRLKIWNNGNKVAENVEVFATKLEKKGKRTFKEDSDFVPLNLCWTYYSIKEKPFFIPLISPGTYKYCTMVKVINPIDRKMFKEENRRWKGVSKEKTILSFETTFPTTSKSFLHPPGKYRLFIIVAAANAKPIEKVIEIDLKGDWYNDRQEMYNKGININVRKSKK